MCPPNLVTGLLLHTVRWSVVPIVWLERWWERLQHSLTTRNTLLSKAVNGLDTCWRLHRPKAFKGPWWTMMDHDGPWAMKVSQGHLTELALSPSLPRLLWSLETETSGTDAPEWNFTTFCSRARRQKKRNENELQWTWFNLNVRQPPSNSFRCPNPCDLPFYLAWWP